MKIINQSTGLDLSLDAKRAISFKDRLFGLIDPQNPRSLIFKTRFGLHTFGLSKSIDILLLNNQNQVVKLTPSFKPNRLYFYSPLYQTVIELPEGSLQKSKTSLNDKIIFA